MAEASSLVRRGLGRGSAAALLLMLSLVVVVLPLLAFAQHLADQLVRGAQREAAYFAATPDQPTWIKGVPLFGRRLGAAWDRIVEVKGTCARCWSPIPQNLEKLMIGAARGLAESLVQVLLSLIVAIMFWKNGDGLVSVLHDALRRLGGPVAEHALDVADRAMCGVACGVIGSAAIQASCLRSA
jgi:predicted PurR-regulated permease PerM